MTNSTDAPRASDMSRRIRGEGCRFPGRPTRQRSVTPKTWRGSSFPNRILRMLHTPALCGGQNIERVVVSDTGILRTLHAPALGRVQNTDRVVVSVGSGIRRRGAVPSPALIQLPVRGRSVRPPVLSCWPIHCPTPLRTPLIRYLQLPFQTISMRSLH